jgi:ABC-type protease/lipase transport system fused ATPase/permease subunit
MLQLVLPLYVMLLYQRVLSSSNEVTLLGISLMACGCLGAAAVLDWIRLKITLRGSRALEKVLEPMLMQAQLQGTSSSRGMGSDGHQLERLKSLISSPGLYASFDLIFIPIFLILLAFIHPLFALIGFTGAILVALFSIVSCINRSKQVDVLIDMRDHRSRWLESGLRQKNWLKPMGLNKIFLNRYLGLESLRNMESQHRSDGAHVIQLFSRHLRLLMQVTSYGTGAYLVLEQAIAPGAMIAAAILLGRALLPLEMGIGGLFEIVAIWPLMSLKVDQEEDEMSTGEPTGDLSVSIEKLSLGEKVVLRGVHFQLKKGEAMAILGKSGSGKTSLCHAISGAIPFDGRVQIGHLPPQHSHGNGLSIIPQFIQLFQGTIAENLSLLSEPDYQHIDKVLKFCELKDRFHELPEGLGTQVGYMGENLSGGMRQLIGIARALYRSPKLMIMDEPTLNLDKETSMIFSRILLKLKASQVTTVLVTHQQSLIAHVDQVTVLGQGNVEHCGTRAEVLASLDQGKNSGSSEKRVL